MKKIKTGMLAIMVLWFFAVPGFGSTIVAVDSSLDLGRIAGIDVFSDLYPTNPSISQGSAASATSWDVYLVLPPDPGPPAPLGPFGLASAERLYDVFPNQNNPLNPPLTAGNVFSITAGSPFTLTNILLYQVIPDSPYWDEYNASPYAWTIQTIGADTVYTVSAVPIPAAAWLLGSGVVGLIALKRRKKNG